MRRQAEKEEEQERRKETETGRETVNAGPKCLGRSLKSKAWCDEAAAAASKVA